MFNVGDKVKNINTGEVGLILDIRNTYCKYPIIVTFDKYKLENMMVSEYNIKTYTYNGHSDWRFDSKEIELLGGE
ncbi:MAG: hypothetical protein ACRCXT_02190 [Paraclostridium sp.]